MGKKPGLLDLVSLIPASDLARVAKTLGVDPEGLTKRLLALDSSGLSSKILDTATRALKPGEAGRLVIDHATPDLLAGTRPHPRPRGTRRPAGARTALRHGHVRGGAAAGRGVGTHGIRQLAPARPRRDQRLRTPLAGGARGPARVRRGRHDQCGAAPHPAGDRTRRRASRVLLRAAGSPARRGQGPLARDHPGLPARRSAPAATHRGPPREGRDALARRS